MSSRDPLLDALISAADERAREHAIASVAVRARQVVDRTLRSPSARRLSPEDVDDVASTAMLLLMQRLRREEIEPTIVSLDDFVARLTFNALSEHYRRCSPERARHKNRVRYALTRDERLAIWDSGQGLIAGLAQWETVTPLPAKAFTLSQSAASPSMLDRDAIGNALASILVSAGRPLPFDDLVRVTAELWGVVEVTTGEPAETAKVDSSSALRVEDRQYLEILWREIRLLSEGQRLALLLNLRDGDGMNAVALILLAGISTFAEIAETMAMTTETLAQVWSELPMTDLKIAEMMSKSRQQVINLRRVARDRLGRRMKAATQWRSS